MDSPHLEPRSASAGLSGDGRKDFSQPVPIPDHQLIRCIGQGSYGAVWLARHAMGMYRAVKIVFRGSFKDARPFQRELSGIQKFEPISRSHEGFIDVLHVGINEAEGYFYYVMELGDDEDAGPEIDPQVYRPKTLAGEISFRRRLPVQDCLKLGLALSEALAELHRHHLVHRDIKPSNIIFVNGVPKLADIGLVAGADEARSYVGTEGFIPPEGPGTERADVYSLGKVLYEASTGKDRQDFPELPTNWDDPEQHNQLIELNEIVLQACKADPKGRYASARDMHAHLLVLENGQSIRRLKYLERLVSNFKRGAGVAALALGLGALVLYHFYREHRFEVENVQRQVGADLANGTHAVDSSDLLAAVPYYINTLTLDNEDPARTQNYRLRIGSVLSLAPRIVQMFFATNEITKMDVTRDGKRVLLGEYNGGVEIRDPITGEALVPRFGHRNNLYAAQFNRDGTLALTASHDTTAVIWRVSDGSKVAVLPHPSSLYCAKFSPDGTKILTGCHDGYARVWDLATNVISKFQIPKRVVAVAFDSNGKRALVADPNGNFWIFDAATGDPILGPVMGGSWVHGACFSPDGTEVVLACEDNKAHIWNLAGSTPWEVRPTLNHDDRVFSVGYSPDGRWIVTGSLDRTARIWRSDTHQLVSPNGVLRHSDRVVCAGFLADGHRVMTGCFGGTARIWDLAGALSEPPPAPGIFSSNASRFLLVSNGQAQLYETADGKSVAEPFALKGEQSEVALDHAGRFLISFSQCSSNRAGRLELRDATNGALAGDPLVLTNPISGYTMDQESSRIVLWDAKQALVWDPGKATLVSLALHPPDIITFATLSPDGSLLGLYGTNWLQMWDVAHAKELFALRDWKWTLSNLVFSPDSQLMATCEDDNDFTWIPARIWDAHTGKLLAQLDHRDAVWCVAFSRDSKRVVTGSQDFTAGIWEARTGHRLTPPLRHGDQVISAGFSEDGHWVLTVSRDGSVRIWDSETGEPLTPSLPHVNPIVRAAFVPGTHLILTRSKLQNNLWPYSIEDRPVAEITSLARLLSGDSFTARGERSLAVSEPVPQLWGRLKARHPEDFVVTAAQVAEWHDAQARACQAARNWPAERFHLEQLIALRPADAEVSNRLARATQMSQK